MAWQAPSFVEIDMNAEIGGYQADDGDSYEPVIAAAGEAGERERDAPAAE
jgi:hypothetical protein